MEQTILIIAQNILYELKAHFGNVRKNETLYIDKKNSFMQCSGK